jgi:hypothetical protein
MAPKPSFRYWAALILVATLGAYLRFTVLQTTVIEDPISADATEYYLSAYNLRHYGVYTLSAARLSDPTAPLAPDAIRYPGLPLIEALFMGQWPDHAAIIRDVQLTNLVAGIAAIILTFLAASCAFPLWVATVTALLAALSPHLISYTVYLLTEPISAMLVAALLAAATLPGTKARGLVSGFLTGTLTMFRPQFLLLAPLFSVTAPRNGRRLILATSIAAAVTVAPWFIRNAVSVSAVNAPSLAAIGLISGAYPDYMLDGDPATFPYPFAYDQDSTQAVMSVGSAVREIGRRFESNPSAMLMWYCCEKIRYMWQWDNIDGAGDVFIYPATSSPFLEAGPLSVIHNVMAILHWPILALASLGSALIWWPPAARNFSQQGQIALRTGALLLIFGTLIHIPFYMSVRYAVPLYPALYMMALLPCVIAIQEWKRRRSQLAASPQNTLQKTVPSSSAMTL